MPKCPKCGKEINKLYNIQLGEMCWEMDEDGEYENRVDLFVQHDETNFWECPECNERLFDNEEEAINFLKGE